MPVFVFAFILTIFLAAPVSAQTNNDNKIRVIQEDGSVIEFEIPPVEPILPETPQAPMQHPPVTAIMSVEPAPPSAPVSVLPSSAASSAPVQAAPKKAAAKKPKKKKIPEATRVESIGRIKAPPAARIVQPGVEIDRDVAVSIALEQAPPARSVKVVRELYQDKPVFVVTFMTEAGPHDVLVDAQSGEILPVKRQAIQP